MKRQDVGDVTDAAGQTNDGTGPPGVSRLTARLKGSKVIHPTFLSSSLPRQSRSIGSGALESPPGAAHYLQPCLAGSNHRS